MDKPSFMLGALCLEILTCNWISAFVAMHNGVFYHFDLFDWMQTRKFQTYTSEFDHDKIMFLELFFHIYQLYILAMFCFLTGM